MAGRAPRPDRQLAKSTRPRFVLNLPAILPTSRGALSLAVLAVFLCWETAQPFIAQFSRDRAGRRRRGRHAVWNLGLGLVNSLAIAAIFVGLWVGVSDWAEGAKFGLLHFLPLPPAGRGILALLTLDLWTYSWHRLNHRVPFLWRFHRLHHSDRTMDVTTASRFHLGEIALSSLLRAPLLASLGARLDELAVYETLLFAVVQFHHANIGLPDWLDRALRCIIVTPHLHKVHHSVVRAEADSNYSSLFSWWDRLFRTFRLSREPRRIVFGVDESR